MRTTTCIKGRFIIQKILTHLDKVNSALNQRSYSIPIVERC
jgi:hypothetical protein